MAVRAADSAAEGHEEIFKLLVDALGPLAVCVRLTEGNIERGRVNGWVDDKREYVAFFVFMRTI